MRVLAALLALLALAGAAAPPRDWRTVAIKTPAGFYLIGNPRARVKLVEYASYTCPHCAHFALESAPVLRDRMIRDGTVSLELRHFFFNALDLGVAVLARCTGPRRFLATTEYIYRTQSDWLDRAQDFAQANSARLSTYPPAAQLRAMVDGSGLTAAIVAQGLAPAAVDACFADRAEIERLAGASRLPDGAPGTPAFLLNGRLVIRVGWAELEPQLRRAGAR